MTSNAITENENDHEKLFQSLVDQYSESSDADLILYNGEISRPYDTFLIQQCIKRKKRKNVVVILVTPGGDPDAAYRMARYFQERYEKFTLYVTGYCKSAGTLMAIGADQIVMSDHAELGPLDIQMSKKDDLLDFQSGLIVNSALLALQEKAFEAFESFFLNVQGKSGGTISLTTAANIATNLAHGLYAPIFQQIDPLHVGESSRANLIAMRYGERLARKPQSCSDKQISGLITSYPSHGFVIDREEASGIFGNVREPTEVESVIAQVLESHVRLPKSPREMDGDGLPFRFLSSEVRSSDNELAAEEGQGEDTDHANEDVSDAVPTSQPAPGSDRGAETRSEAAPEAIAVDGTTQPAVKRDNGDAERDTASA